MGKKLKNSQEILENKNCPNGCLDCDIFILKSYDMLHGLGGWFNVVCCKSCGLTRTNPRPDMKSIGYYYPESYGPYKDNKSSNRIGKLSILKSKIFKDKTKYLPNFSPDKCKYLLELGCSSGNFLDQAVSHGWNVEGVEFSELAAEKAINKGHKVNIGQLERVDLSKNKYHAIVGWMVMEHLHNPNNVLKKINKSLNDKGVFIFSVPNFDSWTRRLFKSYWFNLQVPSHLYHYDKKSLQVLLNNNGFEIIDIKYQANMKDFILSVGHLLKENQYKKLGNFVLNIPKKIGNKIHIMYPLAIIASIFHKSSRMIVFAKKR
jgi:SAM-dependent methyltransferase